MKVEPTVAIRFELVAMDTFRDTRIAKKSTLEAPRNNQITQIIK
jgi:hypothetical protein